MKATATCFACLLALFLLTNCQNQPKQPEASVSASKADTTSLATDTLAGEKIAASTEVTQPALVNVTPDTVAPITALPEKRPASKSSAAKSIPAQANGRFPNFEGVFASQQNDRNYNGTLTIQNLGGYKFSFEIATSGKNGCKGKLKGKSVIQEDGTATWSADGCESLKFTFDLGKVKVEEKGCQKNHGSDCGFAGNYGSGTW